MQSNSKQKPASGILTLTTDTDKGLIRSPTLTPHLRFHDIGEQQTLLVSESFNTLLHGQLTVDLLPLLNSKHTLEELEEMLCDRHKAHDVRVAIVSLANKGYVVSGEYHMDRAQAAYWTSLGASPVWVEECLANSRIHVLEDYDRGLSQKLKATGVQIAADDPELVVVRCDDYLGTGLEEINKHQLEVEIPWLLVRPQGVQPLFGPVFQADGSGPCWKCLSYRLSSHQEVHSFLRNVAGDDAAFKPFVKDATTFEAVLGLIAAEITKWVVLRKNSTLHEHAIAIDTRSFSTSKHRVIRRPQCSACGDEALYDPNRHPEPLHLNSSPKTHRNSGGVRAVAPHVTLEKYRDVISPISGVVTWLTRTTDEADSWLHVYWAGSNPAIRSRSLSSLRRSLRSKSAGKGSTREQSEVSALCEAVERYSGSYHHDEIRIHKTYSEMRIDDEAIHPNDVQLFSDSQLDNAESINAKGHLYNMVPPRFDPNAKIDWTPMWSLSQQRHRYLPTSMLYSMAAEQRGPADLFADSNGCAAGNTMEEAILQGFYELVERDAFAIWWYNQLRMPAVDLDSFDDEFIASARSYYAEYERELWVLDVTADIGIPTFVALSHRPDGPAEDIIYGAGSHAHPQIAAQRAICELNQCLTWLPRPGTRDGRPMVDDPLALWWWQTARLKDCGWLVPATDVSPRTFSDYPITESDDTRDDVEFCRSLVERQDMEFLVLDQTRPDIGMPVARVIVPGMRHFWARFAPGRLYDVPVAMGHRKSQFAESELNPTPVIA